MVEVKGSDPFTGDNFAHKVIPKSGAWHHSSVILRLAIHPAVCED